MSEGKQFYIDCYSRKQAKRLKKRLLKKPKYKRIWIENIGAETIGGQRLLKCRVCVEAKKEE